MEMEEPNNDLHLPLLADYPQQHPQSQLPIVSGADGDKDSPNKKCCKIPKDKELCSLFAFSILSWLGFVLTLYTTYSCDVIHITWNPNSIHLSVTGVGVSRFEETIRKPNLHIKEIKCFDQSSYVQHAEISQSTHFFPTDEFLRKCSILAPTLAGVVFVGVMMYMVVASVEVDKFNRTSNPQYPWKIMISCYVLAGMTLIAAGTAELLAVLDLMNVADPTNDHHESPICNNKYSTCQLGTGGKIAISGVACCYAGSLIAFSAAFVTIQEIWNSGDNTEQVEQKDGSNIQQTLASMT